MKDLVEALCSDACAGRAPGTAGGALARAHLVDAFRSRGLDPFEQPVPGCGGANVLATLPGESDRWVILSAHYDHLGTQNGEIFRGADDNAAAVAILVEVAASLAATRGLGRGVLVAAFDGEEPPHFMTPAMGSMHFAEHPTIPMDRIDMMVCMDLVGHALGPPGIPAAIRDTVFALGSERSAGTGDHVGALEHAVPGVLVRRADADIIPPLSDYAAFWKAETPFLFLTNARSRYYHTPLDTPDRLDYPKMTATARWLERFVRETCARPAGKIPFLGQARDDASTLRSIRDLAASLADVQSEARMGKMMAENLLMQCDDHGRLPDSRRTDVQALVGLLESALA